MDDRKVLLNRVRICDFVLQEIALFLDNNPQNKEALECYQKIFRYAKRSKRNVCQKVWTADSYRFCRRKPVELD